MSSFQIKTSENAPLVLRPTVEVAVVMRREFLDNRWQW